EERHVWFGEEQTKKAIVGKPWLKRRLLGLALVSLWGVGRLESFMKKRLDMNHDALKHLPELLRHSVKMAEIRFERIGLIDRPLSELSTARKLALVGEAYLGKLIEGLVGFVLAIVLLPFKLFGWFGKKRLTDTYLDDPLVRGNLLGPQTDDDDE